MTSGSKYQPYRDSFAGSGVIRSAQVARRDSELVTHGNPDHRADRVRSTKQ